MIKAHEHRRLVLAMTTVSILAGALSASSDVLTREWVQVYDSGDLDQLVDVRYAPNGNIYALLNVSRRSAPEDLRLLCYSPQGILLWQSEPGLGIGAALAIDHLSRAVVAGRTPASDYDPDALVVQIGPDGRTLWSFVHPFNTAQWDLLTAVAVDESGTIFAAGECDNCEGADLWQPIFVRLSPNGVPQCAEIIAVNMHRHLEHFVLGSGMTSSRNGPLAYAAGFYDNLTIAPFVMSFTGSCDAAWLHDFASGHINAISATDDGVIAAGATQGDVSLVEHRGRLGELYSVTTLDVEGRPDEALAMAGAFPTYLVGYGTTKTGCRDVLTARISLPRSIDWVDVVDLSGGGDDSAVDVATLLPNYIATLATSHHQEMVTLLYAPTGVLLGLDSFPGPWADRQAVGVAIDHDAATHLYAGGNIGGDVVLIQYSIGVGDDGGSVPASQPTPPGRTALAVSPIPARGPIAVTYELPEQLPVLLRIVDVTGRVVTTLDETTRTQGRWDLTWDGSASNGVPVRSTLAVPVRESLRAQSLAVP